MKVNKLTPESNLMWDGGTMLQPEHTEAMKEHRHNHIRRQQIKLQEQQQNGVSQALELSLKHRMQIKLRMYHPYEALEVIGVLDRLDQNNSRFMVDGEWFEIGNIEGAWVGE